MSEAKDCMLELIDESSEGPMYVLVVYDLNILFVKLLFEGNSNNRNYKKDSAAVLTVA